MSTEPTQDTYDLAEYQGKQLDSLLCAGCSDQAGCIAARACAETGASWPGMPSGLPRAFRCA